MPDAKDSAFVEILSTFNPADIAMIKSLLDGEGISYYIQGETFNSFRPLVEPARLMVERSHADQANALLQDLIIRYRGLGGDLTQR